MFILESCHTRTLDGPGKASPGHAIREQFGKLRRAANVERWPEQLQAVKDGGLPPKTRAMLPHFSANYLKRALLRHLTLATLSI
jgi:hypothetical protein